MEEQVVYDIKKDPKYKFLIKSTVATGIPFLLLPISLLFSANMISVIMFLVGAASGIGFIASVSHLVFMVAEHVEKESKDYRNKTEVARRNTTRNW